MKFDKNQGTVQDSNSPDASMKNFLNFDPFTGKSYTGVRKDVMRILSKKNVNNKNIADLSCGDGITTYILRKLGASVQHYDLMPESCKLSDKPIYADLTKKFPIKNESFDIVVLQEVIEHIPNQLFILEEIYRILKPGGELILTTPSRSSLQSRFSFLIFESEHLRGTPWGATDAVWGEGINGEKYYGHLWLIGVQKLNALGRIVGFKHIELQKSTSGKTSMALLPFAYPIILILSLRALYRDLRDSKTRHEYKKEKISQFKTNISIKTLLSKHTIVFLKK